MKRPAASQRGVFVHQRNVAQASWNVMAHAQTPDFVFRRNGRVHLYRRGLQFSRLLAAEVCASAVVMADTPCSEVVWRVLATHSIRQFPLHCPSRASLCATTFQLDCTAQGHNTVSIHPYFQLFSSILLYPAAVMHPFGPRPPIWFLVFPLVLWCRSFRLKPFMESFIPPFLLCDLPILIFWF